MRNRAVGGFLVGVVMTLVAGILWLALHDDRPPEVYVQTDARPIQCTGTDVSIDPQLLEDDEAFLIERIELRPGLDCRFRFFVVNDSGDNITIDRVAAPFLAPSSGIGLRAASFNPNNGGPLPLEPIIDGIDLVWPIADTINANSRQWYEVWLEFDSDDCQTVGTFSAPGPQVYQSGNSNPLTYLGPPLAVSGIGFNEC